MHRLVALAAVAVAVSSQDAGCETHRFDDSFGAELDFGIGFSDIVSSDSWNTYGDRFRVDVVASSGNGTVLESVWKENGQRAAAEACALKLADGSGLTANGAACALHATEVRPFTTRTHDAKHVEVLARFHCPDDTAGDRVPITFAGGRSRFQWIRSINPHPLLQLGVFTSRDVAAAVSKHLDRIGTEFSCVSAPTLTDKVDEALASFSSSVRAQALDEYRSHLDENEL
ncbi:hypothetical protein DIPPA_22496 [Diplonema papillatum]|nr:hypothetical protein DIPPA_22496 [Diplonema papillatum]|eukprot:gene13466-20746_t